MHEAPPSGNDSPKQTLNSRTVQSKTNKTTTTCILELNVRGIHECNLRKKAPRCSYALQWSCSYRRALLQKDVKSERREDEKVRTQWLYVVLLSSVHCLCVRACVCLWVGACGRVLRSGSGVITVWAPELERALGLLPAPLRAVCGGRGSRSLWVLWWKYDPSNREGKIKNK